MSDQELLKETEYIQIEECQYENKRISAGFVKKSPHPVDTIYLEVGGMVAHLRSDECTAIVMALSKAMWLRDIFDLDDSQFEELKWISHKDMWEKCAEFQPEQQENK